ncbi:MAG: alpha/beta fold hydrolase [Pseudomonadota bacterium]
MFGRSIFIGLVVALCASFVGSAAVAERFLGRSTEIFDGRKDTTKPAPVVIVLHGFLASSKSMRRAAGYDRVAEQNEFVVVYPNGRFRGWNDARAPANRFDDVGYLSALVRSLIDEGIAQKDRVFMAGHSNGGGMAMRMACDRPGLIAGIAVIATKAPKKYPCESGPSVPAMFLYGTDDPIAPHSGRSSHSRLGGTLSSGATINVWKARNGCSNTAEVRDVNKWQDDTSATIIRFRDCKARLTYVEIEGHGHAWPRSGLRSTLLQGRASQEIDAALVSYQFFEGLR